MADKIRLDKFLVEMGIGTRSQIKEWAKKGRIQIDGQVEKRTERKVDPQTEQVTFDGISVSYVKTEYYMLNKPQGVVSATEDRQYPTVIDLIDARRRKDLFPVGRLDIDTEGLLLITNDGDLAHRLLSPRRHVDKRYFAEIEGLLPEDAARRLKEGILLLDGTPTLPADLEIIKEGQVILTIREGKFHQVKRMFEALGCKVTYLKRLSMGPVFLDENLKTGEYRELTEEEIEKLKNLRN